MVNFSQMCVSDVLSNREKTYLHRARLTLIVAMTKHCQTVKLSLFLTKDLSENLLMYKLMKFLG